MPTNSAVYLHTLACAVLAPDFSTEMCKMHYAQSCRPFFEC